VKSSLREAAADSFTVSHGVAHGSLHIVVIVKYKPKFVMVREQSHI
jgi:hypothetical protein